MKVIIFLVFIVLFAAFVQSDAKSAKAKDADNTKEKNTDKIGEVKTFISKLKDHFKELFKNTDKITPELIKKATKGFPQFGGKFDDDFSEKTFQEELYLIEFFLTVLELTSGSDHFEKFHNEKDVSDQKKTPFNNANDKKAAAKKFLEDVKEYIFKVAKITSFFDAFNKKGTPFNGGLSKPSKIAKTDNKFGYGGQTFPFTFDWENANNEYQKYEWSVFLLKGLEEYLNFFKNGFDHFQGPNENGSNFYKGTNEDQFKTESSKNHIDKKADNKDNKKHGKEHEKKHN